MTVVIDVGAARYGDDYSIERLLEQFEPTHLYAVDPNPALVKPAGFNPHVELVHKAAWIFDGEVRFRDDGLRSLLTNDPSASLVPCFDLARFIDERWLEYEQPIVLKLDCEGSEYELLDWIIFRNADTLLDLCLVEWHQTSEPSHEALAEEIIGKIRCELREWPY